MLTFIYMLDTFFLKLIFFIKQYNKIKKELIMFFIELNPIKRIVAYFAIGILWRFLFIGMFSFVMGYDYIFGYLQDSALSSLLFGALISVAFETMRIVI